MSGVEVMGGEGLERFRIAGLPPNFYYVADFISVEEEASILQKIPAQRWTHLTHRRLQAHPSTLTKNNTLLAAPLPQWLTSPMLSRFEKLGLFRDTPHREPNHVLINEYGSGEGIMAHEDGGAYARVVATVSLGGSVCLDVTSKVGGSSEEKGDDGSGIGEKANGTNGTDRKYSIPTRILQEPRSLLITTGPAYEDLLHGISPVEVDDHLDAETVANWSLLGDSHVFEDAGGRNERATRISLTYRDVLKVSSAASKVLGGLGRR
ncbi:alkB, alkylation repair protein 6 [Massarina eburnea CBS 473.64]|uniref:AlkB, alkylation repair protein 6 n=1 Tax=Massarina eburnea CBS 473.64 TaxID=1395130 RepID=A0A6A6RP69_9PLEO|nr:alkB, alkylation repair protein 6 [Massarina eburnea CBS 473.64]